MFWLLIFLFVVFGFGGFSSGVRAAFSGGDRIADVHIE